MIELRFLGSIEVEGVGVGAVEALLAQPKRLAVLAYLTLRAPRAFLRRESLVATFWPDRPVARGRGSLRNAVHFLRVHLGHDAIPSRADELGVNPGLVRCDALGFADHLDARRWGDALSLYRGDLLTGLGGVGPAGFAQWLDEERAESRRQAERAAWALAERAEERRGWISAVDHARRATALSGDHERAVRRLMRLLDRAGDGVAAIREYESFAGRWRRGHGIEPSADTRALARAIRRGAAERADRGTEGAGRRSASGASRSAGRARGRAREPAGLIAVLPFLQTRGGAEDAHLAGGLTHGVIASLSRLSSIRVIARTSVERFGQGLAHRDLRPIAEELGVDTVLQGSLGRSGDGLTMAAQLVEARTGAPLWAEIYECDPHDLLSVQGELVETILDVLGVELSPQERERLEGRPTRSREAFQDYMRGRHHVSLRSIREVERAISLFESALELDPEYALAHAGLAEAFLVLWPIGGSRRAEAKVRAREAARSALEADHRLGEAHAALGMVCGMLERDWPGAEAHYRRAIELSPGHATAHHWYGCTLAFWLRRFEASRVELDVAHELDPLSPIISNDRALALLHEGRVEQAIEGFRHTLELEPRFARTHHDFGVALAISGDPEAGVEQLERGWRLGAYGADPNQDAPESSSREGWRGTLERRLEELRTRNPNRGLPAFQGALVSMLLGRSDDALTWLDRVEKEGSLGVVQQYRPVFEPLLSRPELAARFGDAGSLAG